MTWYLRKALGVLHERQDLSYFLAAPQILTFFQEESNLWKHQLLSASAAWREQQHMLHMLKGLWKSIEHHVLVLKNQWLLHLYCDSKCNHLMSSSFLMWMPQEKAEWKLRRVVTLSLHVFSRSIKYWLLNIKVINSLIHLVLKSYWYQRTGVKMNWQGGAVSQRC